MKTILIILMLLPLYSQSYAQKYINGNISFWVESAKPTYDYGETITLIKYTQNSSQQPDSILMFWHALIDDNCFACGGYSTPPDWGIIPADTTIVHVIQLDTLREDYSYLFNPGTHYYIVAYCGASPKDSATFVINPITGISSQTIPNDYALYNNYPNPFNPSTTITYHVPSRAAVILEVYNLLGKKIETLVNENKQPGTHSVEFKGSHLSSGVYFCKLIIDKYTETKKMVLLK